MEPRRKGGIFEESPTKFNKDYIEEFFYYLAKLDKEACKSIANKTGIEANCSDNVMLKEMVDILKNLLECEKLYFASIFESNSTVLTSLVYSISQLDEQVCRYTDRFGVTADEDPEMIRVLESISGTLKARQLLSGIYKDDLGESRRCPNYEEIVSKCQESVLNDVISVRCKSEKLKPYIEFIKDEATILKLLLQVQLHLADFNYFKTIITLANLTSKLQLWKRKFINSKGVKRDGISNSLFEWFLKFYEHLISKSNLYFDNYLTQGNKAIHKNEHSDLNTSGREKPNVRSIISTSKLHQKGEGDSSLCEECPSKNSFFSNDSPHDVSCMSSISTLTHHTLSLVADRKDSNQLTTENGEFYREKIRSFAKEFNATLFAILLNVTGSTISLPQHGYNLNETPASNGGGSRRYGIFVYCNSSEWLEEQKQINRVVREHKNAFEDWKSKIIECKDQKSNKVYYIDVIDTHIYLIASFKHNKFKRREKVRFLNWIVSSLRNQEIFKRIANRR